MAAPLAGIALQVRQAMVAVREVPQQRRIVARLPREVVEVGQALLDEEPPGRRGAREVADRVVELVQERIRELPHVVEAPLRPGLGGPRAARLPHGHHDSAGERRDDERRRSETHTMAAHELAGPISRRAASRQHGNAREVPADVLGQLVRGGIAQLGFLAHRLQDDRVEIAAQPPRQARDRFAAPGHRRVRPRARLRHRRARPLGIPLADHPDQLLRVSRRDAVRLPAREQLVQHDAERIDVARGRDAAAAHLLGARVLGGHEPHLGSGLRGRLGRAVGLEQLGDAEVEQLRHARGGDEDVAGLDVAVHDEALVRVLHGAADLPEEREAAVDRQAPVVAPLDERLPLHVLEDEVGLARLRRPAVEQARDVGVIERRPRSGARCGTAAGRPRSPCPGA